MSADEVRHFKKFNELHQKYEPEEKNSFFKRARILLNRSNLVINEDIALAFQPLNCCWIKPPKFKPWDYKNFLENTLYLYMVKEKEFIKRTTLRRSVNRGEPFHLGSVFEKTQASRP